MRDGSRRQREQAQASNISSRGRRQQSRRRQRCIRRQRQQQEEAAAASAAAVEQEQEAAVKGTSCNNIWVLEQAVQDVACLFRLHDSSFAAHGCRGQVLDKRIFFFAKTLSFRLSFCYRFGLRFSYVFVYVEASMQCDKKRTTRWAGSKWTAWLLSLAAWMCNSCSLAAGLLGSLVARQLSRLTAWQLYIYICKYIYIVGCISLSYSVDVIVFFLPYRFTMVWTCF